MMAQELVTAVQEGIKLTVVLVENHGFASIGSLSESIGSGRFGTALRSRSATGRLDGDVVRVDLAANAASLGVAVTKATSVAELAEALSAARSAPGSVLIHIETDPLVAAPDSESWWDVPVAEVSELEPTQQARAAYEAAKRAQRRYW